MRSVSVRDMVLLNGFFAVLLLVCAALFFWVNLQWRSIADDYKGSPELIPNHYYSKGDYVGLRKAAVDCYKLQDEVAVLQARAISKNSIETGWALVGVALLLVLSPSAFQLSPRNWCG